MKVGAFLLVVIGVGIGAANTGQAAQAHPPTPGGPHQALNGTKGQRPDAVIGGQASAGGKGGASLSGTDIRAGSSSVNGTRIRTGNASVNGTEIRIRH